MMLKFVCVPLKTNNALCFKSVIVYFISALIDGSNCKAIYESQLMRNIIQQTVNLPAPAEELFAMYLDASKHAAITGGPVVVGDTQGAPFEAFGGLLSGTILTVVKSRLIVQSWRSASFHDEDLDSTLILTFADDDNGGQIDLFHLDVPDHDLDGVTKGWEKYYWTPWREYLTTTMQG